MQRNWKAKLTTIVALVALGLMASAGLVSGSASAADLSLIHVGDHNNNSINDPLLQAAAANLSCPAGYGIGAYFVITQLNGASTGPTSISVTWSDGTVEQTVPRLFGEGNPEVVAKYLTQGHATGYAFDASAYIFSTWPGEFTLSHYECSLIPESATIDIAPLTAVNNVGPAYTGDPAVARQFDHTFTVTVSGHPLTSALSGVIITPTSTGTITSTGCTVTYVFNATTNTATCQFTIHSEVVGSFTASASATGTVGSTAFGSPTPISTGTTGNGANAAKDYACKTHSLTIYVLDAGKTAFSYSQFTKILNPWTITGYYSYSIDGGTTYSSPYSPMTMSVFHDGGVGDLDFSGSAIIPTTASPYTALVKWYFTIDAGTTNLYTGAATPKTLSGGLPNDAGNPATLTINGTDIPTGYCNAADTAASPLGTMSITKRQDLGTIGSRGSGLGFEGADVPLSGWTFTALCTSTICPTNTTVTSAATNASGLTSLPLDSFLAWTVSENLQDGYVQTYLYKGTTKQSGTNFNVAVGDVDASWTFGNFKTIDLTVTKTASPAFNRTYGWAITKTADRKLVNQQNGFANFNYTVTAAQASPAYTDSGWTVTGVITVNNANPVAVTLTSISDAVAPAGATCTVDTTTNGLSVPAWTSANGNGSLTAAYTCTWTANPGSSTQGNTATATWATTGNQSFMANTSGTASNSPAVTFAFTAPKLINDCVNVTDPNGAAPLGGTSAVTVCIGDLTNGKYAINYAKAYAVPASGCATYPNTASFTTEPSANDTDPYQTGSASQSVQVCSATRTQGFWSTHTVLTNYVWTTLVTDPNLKNVSTWAGSSTTCTKTGAIDATTTTGSNEVMGAFFADIAKTTAKTNYNRSATDQARMQLLQQMMAAILNTYGLGNSAGSLITDGLTAYCGTSASAMLAAATALDTFNNGGDTVALPAAIGAIQGNATSTESKKEANIAFWDKPTTN